MKIHKILIANRGEIASRIIRTCDKMAIHTVAVYSEADATLPYVREDTESVSLPGVSNTETYLNSSALIRYSPKR